MIGYRILCEKTPYQKPEWSSPQRTGAELVLDWGQLSTNGFIWAIVRHLLRCPYEHFFGKIRHLEIFAPPRDEIETRCYLAYGDLSDRGATRTLAREANAGDVG